MHAIVAKTIPATDVTHVVRDEDCDCARKFRRFGQSPGDESRTGRIQHNILISEHTRTAGHHKRNPTGIALGADAVLNYRFKKWMPRRRAKCIVPNLPIHSMMLPKVRAKRK